MLTLVRDDATRPPGGPSTRVTMRWCDHAGQPFAFGMTDGAERWIDWPRVGLFRFDPSSSEVRFRASPTAAADVTADLFIRAVQPLILQAQGRPVLHASASASPRGVVAFCGLSGAGKSTIAYALSDRLGWPHVADDALVLQGAPSGAWVALALPFHRRLRESAAAHFGVPAGVVGAPVPAAAPRSLRAVVVLHQSPDVPVVPVVEALARPAAFVALLTHAHCFDEDDREGVGRLAADYLSLAAAVPVFRLTYRPDFAQFDTVVAAIERLAAGAR